MAEAVGADGVRVAYEAHGVGGPGVVFVHGWSCDRRFWAPQVERLAGRARVVALDLRGHGASTTGPAYDVPALASDVLAVAAAEGLGRPVVVGHSLGGIVALHLAASGAVAAAAMADPPPLVGPLRAAIEGMGDAFAGDEDGSLRRRFAGSMFLPTDDPARRAWITDEMASRPLEVAGPAFAAVAAYDAAAALGRVDVPLLSIGAEPTLNPPADLRAACPSIAVGQTVGAGHFHQLEVPEQVGAMLERFLEVHGLLAPA